MTATLLPGVRWCAAKDGDPRGLSLYRRHYSANHYRDGRERWRRLFVGPGEKLVLLTAPGDALFVWRRELHRLDGQEGVGCAIFRNESVFLSSDLIREACDLAWVRWPGERLWTYVNPRKLPQGKRPGYCFEAAGWARCGVSKGGLLILEVRPAPAGGPH
jgi:hypothetical protein